jgi:beta-lactamase class C
VLPAAISRRSFRQLAPGLHRGNDTMMPQNRAGAVIAALLPCALLPMASHAGGSTNADIETVVTHAIQPVMERYGIPGMAVGIIARGQTVVYNRGVASKATARPVDDDTLFEIGSVSKTFTATLAAYAQISGRLSLSDKVSQYLPALRGSSWDSVSALNLATHTPGGLPLLVPDGITEGEQVMAYFRGWKPAYAPGTYRTYSNQGIGLLGLVAAQSLNGDFATLEQATLFAGLGLHHTYLDVPPAESANYAQGYTVGDKPVRLNPGALAAETYGIRTTAADLLRFVAANLGMLDLDERLQQAIIATHTGYFQLGAMTQDLVWEQYRYLVSLPDLLAGNADKVILQANPVTALDPPLPPRDDVLINKTGATNGFAAYVAFVPEKRLGIVVLANKSYPIAAGVTVAFEILTQLGDNKPKP